MDCGRRHQVEGCGTSSRWQELGCNRPSRAWSNEKEVPRQMAHVLDPSVDRTTGRKGHWTSDEDDNLKDAVHIHDGKNWNAVAALVPGRTKSDCCSRWRKCLDPNRSATREKITTLLTRRLLLWDSIVPFREV
jgi:hypothetical protein